MKQFKFFQGYTSTLNVVWNITAPQIDMDVENELISLLSQEISREIDDEILRQVTQNINSGNNNLDYFNRWMDIGNNRA